MPLKILVIGSGGREHALVQTCLSSPLVESVIAAPGNGGMAQSIPCYPLDVNDNAATVALAQEQGANFVIVGPEAPLANGVVDALEAVDILAYGPRQKAAALEASKALCKSLLEKYKIPTARHQTFRELEPALDYLHKQTTPIVIKASGLAAGKGVIIAQDQAEAEVALRAMLQEGAFGESGKTVVVEEFLQGEEASIHLIVSGKDYVVLPASQDHKRIGENDTGANTGGMGAYAPVSIVTPALERTIIEEIIEPTLEGLEKEGIEYRGTLYIGLMLTESGPKVLEFNVRFGDPETQVLLPLFATDPIALLYDCARGQLPTEPIRYRDAHAAVVVMAAKGYPGSYQKGESISLPDSVPEGTAIVHAGTALQEDGSLLTAGGRVLGITAAAPNLDLALERVYNLCQQVDWQGKVYRSDIGARELRRRHNEH